MPAPSLSQLSPPVGAASASEIVTRPEPGLSRGEWEAPAWAFWMMLVLVVASAAAYLGWRLGWLGPGKRAERAPVSRRTGRP